MNKRKNAPAAPAAKGRKPSVAAKEPANKKAKGNEGRPAVAANGADKTTKTHDASGQQWDFVVGDPSLPTVDFIKNTPAEAVSTLDIVVINGRSESTLSWKTRVFVTDEDGKTVLMPLRTALTKYHQIRWPPKQFEPGKPYVMSIPLKADDEEDAKLIDFWDHYKWMVANYLIGLPDEDKQKVFGDDWELITLESFNDPSFWKGPVAFSGASRIELRVRFTVGFDKKPSYVLIDFNNPNKPDDKMLPGFIQANDGICTSMFTPGFYVMRVTDEKTGREKVMVGALCDAAVAIRIPEDEMNRLMNNGEGISADPNTPSDGVDWKNIRGGEWRNLAGVVSKLATRE